MKIKFFGAVSEVTGSKHLLEVNGKKILLDCGMFQGRRHDSEEKNKHFGFDAKEIDACVLSHAHIDHSGLIPLLVKNGFTGSVHSTKATKDLCASMLRDSAFIQEKDAEYIKEKNFYSDDPHEVEPLYTIEDAEDSLNHFLGHSYNKEFELFDGIKINLRDAGHVLGSAIVEIFLRDGNEEKKIVFTGDLGRKRMPILKDPEIVDEADFLITESTYGNRLHDEIKNEEEKIVSTVKRAYQYKGKIIIPAFALERTQELLYMLNKLYKEGRIPAVKIFVDSPLAINLTEIFSRHSECFDKETKAAFLMDNQNPFGFGNIEYTRNVDESKAINNYPEPAIIISASGMCEFGRIRHHLRNHISNPSDTILIVGYMAEGTLGRRLVENSSEVKIFGERHRVRAEIDILNGFSAHADKNELLDFATNFKKTLKKVFIVHGDPDQSSPFSELIKSNNLAKDVLIPNVIGEEFEI